MYLVISPLLLLGSMNYRHVYLQYQQAFLEQVSKAPGTVLTNSKSASHVPSVPSTTVARQYQVPPVSLPAVGDNQLLTVLATMAAGQNQRPPVHLPGQSTFYGHVPPTAVTAITGAQNEANPFMLKFKTRLIRVCQACRKGFDNDTFVIARQERRMIQNTSTGTVFQWKTM